MLQKRRILIIDDEPDLTMLVKLNLEKTGKYEVRQENRAIRGLSAAREFKPELVLLDVMMPDLDGGDVLAQLKADANLKDVPVVFLTATVLKEEVAKKGGTIGGYPFIPKPFRSEVLLDRIEKILPPPAPAAPARDAREAREGRDRRELRDSTLRSRFGFRGREDRPK